MFMEYSGIFLIVVGLLTYRWIQKVYVGQPKSNHPMIFWNPHRVTIILALPLLLSIAGIIVSFVNSTNLGLISIAIVVIGNIVFAGTKSGWYHH